MRRLRTGHERGLPGHGVSPDDRGHPQAGLLPPLCNVEVSTPGLAAPNTDGLILDFGGNAVRHGPVDPMGVHKPGTLGGAPPVKECPKCHVLMLIDCTRCPNCGFVFMGFAAYDDPASGAAALPIQARQLLGTRHGSSANAGRPIRGRRRPLRTSAASAMLGFFISVLRRYRSESCSA